MTRRGTHATDERNRSALQAIDAERVKAGTCRHCGGRVPCWSRFGDWAPGRRHTATTYRRYAGTR